MIFKILSSGSLGWKAALGSILALNEEAGVKITTDGIEVNCMDISRVSLVSFKWLKSNFSEYEVKSDVTLGVRVVDFSKIIDRADKDDDIKIEDANDGAAVQISVGSKKQFLMKLINKSGEESKTPQFTTDTSFSVPLKELQSILTDISLTGDIVTIEGKTDAVWFTGKGDGGNAKSVIDVPGLKSESNINLDIDSIQNLLKSVSKSVSDVTLAWAKEKSPLHIVLNVDKMGEINYYLSPVQDSPYK